MACIGLGLGHIGRTGGRPPARWEGLSEDQLVLQYMSVAADRLLREGHEVCVLGFGRYVDRQHWARANCDLVIEGHVNSAETPRRMAQVFYDKRQPDGRHLADALAGELSYAFGDHVIDRVLSVGVPDPRWPSGIFHLIENTYPKPAVVFEPGFINEPTHGVLWSPSGLADLGNALAAGILRFLGHP